MNYEEIENKKKVSKEMEEKLLKTMKQKHLERLSVMQYINDIQITRKEKACLLGSTRNFEQLKQAYARKSSNCQLLLEAS